MVEYTVETLVHLYDSLNYQIEKVLDTLRDFNKICVDPHLVEEYRDDLEAQQAGVQARLEKLQVMRNNVEKLLDKILKAEVEE